MFATISGILALLPQLVNAGIVTVDAVSKIKSLISEDRSMTPEERAELEAKIAEREAVLNDTSRDV